MTPHGGRQITGLPLVSWKDAHDGSSGEGRVHIIHRYRCPSIGFYAWRNGGLSHRIMRGMATTHVGIRMAIHGGRRGKGLLPVHALMPPTQREVGDGCGHPIHRDELVEVHWSVRRNNGLTHWLRRRGRQLTVIGWGAKRSSRSGRTTSPT